MITATPSQQQVSKTMADTTRNSPRSIYHMTDADCPLEVVDGCGSYLTFHPDYEDDAYQARTNPLNRRDLGVSTRDEQPANLVGGEDDLLRSMAVNFTADRDNFMPDLRTMSNDALATLIDDARGILIGRSCRNPS